MCMYVCMYVLFTITILTMNATKYIREREWLKSCIQIGIVKYIIFDWDLLSTFEHSTEAGICLNCSYWWYIHTALLIRCTVLIHICVPFHFINMIENELHFSPSHSIPCIYLFIYFVALTIVKRKMFLRFWIFFFPSLWLESFSLVFVFLTLSMLPLWLLPSSNERIVSSFFFFLSQLHIIKQQQKNNNSHNDCGSK